MSKKKQVELQADFVAKTAHDDVVGGLFSSVPWVPTWGEIIAEADAAAAAEGADEDEDDDEEDQYAEDWQAAYGWGWPADDDDEPPPPPAAPPGGAGLAAASA